MLNFDCKELWPRNRDSQNEPLHHQIRYKYIMFQSENIFIDRRLTQKYAYLLVKHVRSELSSQ